MSHYHFLQGPEFMPTSGIVKKAVTFFHGVGSNGHDLIELVPFLKDDLPNTAFFSPNGIAPYDMSPYGYQWFSLKDRDPGALHNQLSKITPLVKEYINGILNRLNLEYNDLALFGFSQGTMTALHAGLNIFGSTRVNSIVAFSGAFNYVEGGIDSKAKPPICLIHGMDDDVVLHEKCILSEQKLKALSIPVEAHSLPGLKHSIDARGMDIAKRFLKKHLIQE